MALIKCPECNKEISDKVKTCIHCGYPLQEDQPTPVQNNTMTGEADHSFVFEPSLINVKSKKKFPKIAIPVIGVIILIIATILIYSFTTIIPQNKYTDAVDLLECGKYDEAKTLLDKIGNYKDVEIIQEQIKYESIAYNCINDLKKYLKNPDSYSPYEIMFYLGEKAEEDAKPACVMHYGAQNGFGGNTTGYALFTYSKDKDEYSLLGTVNTLKEDDLNKKDDDYTYNFLILTLINSYKDSGIEIGDINMARLKIVLKNDAYSTIKIIN